jgi:aspartate aminotransferase
MFELATQMRADGGGAVNDLSLGNPSLEPPAVWREAIRDLLADEPRGMHKYMTNAGYPEVRGFIAERESKRYGVEFEAADVTMTVGAAGALNVLMRSICEPGEKVLVPAPYFSEYAHYCVSAGSELAPVPTNPDFSLDVDALVEAITPDARILLLNSPNNPTGAIYSADSLRALAEAIRAKTADHARPFYVIEDSPYRDVVFDRDLHVASMLEYYDQTIFVTSHSKDLGLAGERIGYLLISPKARGRNLLRRATGFCNRVLGFVNAPALMQRALPLVLGHPEGRVEVEVYEQNCQRMAAGIRELGFVLPDPQAGFFLFPRLPEALLGPEDADIALTEKLREQRTIVVPGTAFGVPGHLRLSMCVDPPVVDRALAAFRQVCG